MAFVISSKGDSLKTLGLALILAGVAVWAVYGALRWMWGLSLAPAQVLPYHLAGVVPGFILRRHRLFIRLAERLCLFRGDR